MSNNSPYTNSKLNIGISCKEYEYIKNKVHRKSHINIGDSRKDFVIARLWKRLQLHGLNSYEEYCNLLESAAGEKELSELIDAIATNHTFFFREPDHFHFLETTALRNIYENLEPGTPMMIWSAGCSTGEEPYSIAITLREALEKQAMNMRWQIECTDISTKVLNKAKEGIFRADHISKVPGNLRAKYFGSIQQDDGKYVKARPLLHQNINFKYYNLFDNKSPSAVQFHMIFCRNVMIYFDSDSQEQLVNKFYTWMKPGGYFFISHTESLTRIKHKFEKVRASIYRKPFEK